MVLENLIGWCIVFYGYVNCVISCIKCVGLYGFIGNGDEWDIDCIFIVG